MNPNIKELSEDPPLRWSQPGKPGSKQGWQPQPEHARVASVPGASGSVLPGQWHLAPHTKQPTGEVALGRGRCSASSCPPVCPSPWPGGCVGGSRAAISGELTVPSYTHQLRGMVGPGRTIKEARAQEAWWPGVAGSQSIHCPVLRSTWRSREALPEVRWIPLKI